jgi:hypothetical protein
MNNFTVFAFRGNLADGMIPVPHNRQQFFVVENADPGIFFRVQLGDLKGSIGAAIVQNDIFPVLIGLGQYAFNALRQMGFTVVNGSDDADKRLWSSYHLALGFHPYIKKNAYCMFIDTHLA